MRALEVPEPGAIAIVAHGGTNAVAITHLLDIPCVPWEWSQIDHLRNAGLR